MNTLSKLTLYATLEYYWREKCWRFQFYYENLAVILLVVSSTTLTILHQPVGGGWGGVKHCLLFWFRCPNIYHNKAWHVYHYIINIKFTSIVDQFCNLNTEVTLTTNILFFVFINFFWLDNCLIENGGRNCGI